MAYKKMSGSVCPLCGSTDITDNICAVCGYELPADSELDYYTNLMDTDPDDYPLKSLEEFSSENNEDQLAKRAEAEMKVDRMLYNAAMNRRNNNNPDEVDFTRLPHRLSYETKKNMTLLILLAIFGPISLFFIIMFLLYLLSLIF